LDTLFDSKGILFQNGDLRLTKNDICQSAQCSWRNFFVSRIFICFTVDRPALNEVLSIAIYKSEVSLATKLERPKGMVLVFVLYVSGNNSAAYFHAIYSVALLCLTVPMYHQP
jgi:hypothetical protein